MTPKSSAPSFFVLGGTLKTDAPSYVQRRADTELHQALLDGQFCYVLTSRQMGKSSLMVRMVLRLRQEGLKAPVLDLTALGQNLSVEQWYLGLLGRFGSQIGLEEELEDFWDAHPKLSPLQRWMAAIREVALKRLDARIVIFIDEIDATRSLPFSADEFFAGIREFYNERTENPDLERLTFCLLGVATPYDLIQDTRTTPFNIGQRIDLTDFTEEEARVLLPGLNRPDDVAWTLVRRILYWTGGHPYLTQRLCQSVSASADVMDASGVDRLCEELFLSTKARERDDNLLFVRDRMLRGAADPVALLALYSSVLSGKRVQNEPAHPLFSVLRLSGVVRVEDGYLHIRNRIYERVFNKDFVTANQPLDEIQRQRAAERRGRIRVLKVAIPIGAVFLILLGAAVFEWRRALAEHEQKEDLSAKDSKLFENLKTTVNAGLGKASGVATEMYDASRNDPGLLNAYGKTIQANNQFADAMLTVEPNNFFATNLKTYNLYLEADASLRSDRNNAVRDMQQAGQQAEQLEASSDNRLRAIAARTYAGMDEIFSRLDQPKAAAAASKKAIDLGAQLSSPAPPDDDFTLRTLALAYDMLATAEEQAEHWDGALKFFQREVEFEQQAYNLYPKTDNRRFGIAHDALEARNRIGSIEMKINRSDQARQVYQDKSLPIASLLELNAGPTDKLRAERDLWTVQDTLAYIAATQRKTRADALKYYSEAIATGDKIVNQDGSFYVRKRLEQELHSRARVETLLHKVPEARATYKKYLFSVRQRAAQSSDTAGAFDLASAYESVANFELHHDGRAEAIANYASAAQWLTKSTPENPGVLEKLAAVERKLGALQSSDQSKLHYEKAAQASQKAIDLLRKQPGGGDAYAIQRQLQASYEDLAFCKIALGNKAGAAAALASSLDAARDAAEIADDAQRKRATLFAGKRDTEALGSLAWAEVLNNHPRDAVRHAEEAVQRDPAQPWLKVNLLHAYLLANQIDLARQTYRDNRDEEVYDDLFQLAVIDEFDELRKLGLNRAAMAEFEKLRAVK